MKTNRKKYLQLSADLDKLENDIFTLSKELLSETREKIKELYGVPIATQTRVLNRKKYNITARKALEVIGKITKS